ncbi:hypothetical protein [Ramlibacter sp. AN1133]|uniref:hypothetical protein n=1 Tax=Ramlibacter sp. AN1133 TaxID=3133429 RepID=UPI0030BB1C18
MSLTMLSPPLRDVTYEGLPAHQKRVEIGYAGDVAALTGRVVYVKLVQPDSVYLFDSIVQPGAGQSVLFTLAGNALHTFAAGHATGTLQLFVCVDTPDCATPLGNSPLRLEYDIEVLAGLAFSANSLEQTTNFGAAVPASELAVTLPSGASDWFYTPISTPADALQASVFLVPSWMHRSGNTITFAPPADLVPGVYAQEFQFTTVVPDPVFPSQPQQLVRRLLVRHTVVATGIYVATPASVEITQSLSANPAGLPTPTLVSQVGGRFHRLGVRSDSHPPAAEGHPLLATWLVEGQDANASRPSYEIHYCGLDELASRICLPEGTYRGVQLMRHIAPNGTETDFEIPIAFTVTP